MRTSAHAAERALDQPDERMLLPGPEAGECVILRQVKPLQALVRDVVSPVLRAHGYTRSSGTFRKVTHLGTAVVHVSGRGSIGLTDLDFSVSVGFTLLAEMPSQVTAEQVIVAHGANTWSGLIDDPAMPRYFGQSWLFNQGDELARQCFTDVLDHGASDLLGRLDLWPTVPLDSLSDPPVFSRPVEVGARPEHWAYYAKMHEAMGREWPWSLAR